MPLQSTSPTSGRTLAIGFGATVAMWVVAYFSLMQPGLIVGEALFALTLGCLLIGGIVAGRTLAPGENAAAVGAKIGITSAALNLLLIGSVIGGKSESEKILHALIWIGGLFAASIILAIVGSLIGDATKSHNKAPAPAQNRNWIYGFACIAAATVLLLLMTGGLVTGMKAGLAVPDWPNSFGHNMLLYPVSGMVGNVFYEHAHRLYGTLVGVTAITLVVAIFLYDDRKWIRGVAVLYLLMVCAQGVMGGLRVSEISTALAIVHGIFGQLVFAAIMCIAAFTSTTWKSDRLPEHSPAAKTDRRYSHFLSIALVFQLALGATYRHMQRAMENPPQPVHPLYTHILLAVIITVMIIFVGGRAWSIHRDQPVLPALGRTLLILLGLQLVLGVSAVVVVWMSKPHEPIPAYELIVTTAHQITGALLLATSSLLTLWTRRLLAKPGEAPRATLASEITSA